jgi:hypothetical protein
MVDGYHPLEIGEPLLVHVEDIAITGLLVDGEAGGQLKQ